MLDILENISLIIAGIFIPLLLSIKLFQTVSNQPLLFLNRINLNKIGAIKLCLLIFSTLAIISLKLAGKNFFGPLQLQLLLTSFIFYLIVFRRIEIVLIPLGTSVLSWVWTVALIDFFGIPANNYSLIVYGFIAGYSLIGTKSLTLQNKYGSLKKSPLNFPLIISIILLIIALGVGIFSRDHTISQFAIHCQIGLISVLIINQVFSSIVFELLTRQGEKFRKEPLTLANSFISVFSLLLFIVESFLLTLIIPIIYLFPISLDKKKFIIHTLICASSKFILWINFSFKKIDINIDKLDFSKPSVIVSNHQSHLDLMLILRLNPKIIAITNKWVWNNPIYGIIVRVADFYPVYNGIDADFDKIRAKVAKGFSVLIFPEGGRTPDGSIKRYHQGAFKIAQELNLDIQPILIHGAYQCLPKTEFFLRSGKISLKYFDKIKVEPVNIENNETYRKQAKVLTEFMRKEYKLLSKEQEDVAFFNKTLLHQYIYKGATIEKQARKKLAKENNFAVINSLIPTNHSIVEFGCGVGHICLMLKYYSKERQVAGIDLDAEKIKIAKQTIIDRTDIDFSVANTQNPDLPDGDTYIISSWPKENQTSLIEKSLIKLKTTGQLILQLENTIPEEALSTIAKKNGFSLREIDDTTSKTYLFQHEQ